MKLYVLNCLRMSYRAYSSHAKEVSIYLSVSHDPFENLAFEDWVYEKVDLAQKRILFLWRNKPTIVIGRHQNPWLECNLKKLKGNGVGLARRKSGGGTVYHDLGNLNITFFSNRSSYDRKENLALIVKALKNRWKMDVQATPRDDIYLEKKYKRTSSKLGRSSTYHHCTLLLDVDTKRLNELLQPTYDNLTSKATASVRAEVKNMCDVKPSLEFNNVAMEIASEYSVTYTGDPTVRYQIFDPSNERDFPGISEYARELQTWQWIYGKTPRFNVPFTMTLSSGPTFLLSGTAVDVIQNAYEYCVLNKARGDWQNMREVLGEARRDSGSTLFECSVLLQTISFTCFHGVIEGIEIHIERTHLDSLLQQIATSLTGVHFSREDVCSKLNDLNNSLSSSHLEQSFTSELLHWMNQVLF